MEQDKKTAFDKYLLYEEQRVLSEKYSIPLDTIHNIISDIFRGDEAPEKLKQDLDYYKDDYRSNELYRERVFQLANEFEEFYMLIHKRFHCNKRNIRKKDFKKLSYFQEQLNDM